MSKIPLHYSLKLARAVVNKIDLPKNIAKDCTVDSWSNCREQGLCISANIGVINKWKKFAIAQQRNSDDILIVEGLYHNFDIQTNQPNDEVWGTGRAHFRYDQISEAAKFIENQITETYGTKPEAIKAIKPKSVKKTIKPKKPKKIQEVPLGEPEAENIMG